MAEARMLCGYTQRKAARLLGYSNSSKLAKIENSSDTDSVPFMLIHKASNVYNVSMDYLYGLSTVYERDTVLAQ
ncbi:MAG: helix-turn-helix domain-containing protein, partial [Methylomarinum sp.]|nr:helix-turn-helix domain-containing protein [Methylomarinum sp.]